MATTRRPGRTRPLAAASTALVVAAAVSVSVPVVDGPGDPTTESSPSPTVRPPDAAGPVDIALAHLHRTFGAGGAAQGLTEPTDDADLELRVSSTARSEGVTHVYVQQQLDGIDIDGAGANVAIVDGGAVGHTGDRIVVTDDGTDGFSATDGSSAARDVDAVGAVELVLEQLDVEPTEPLSALGGPLGAEQLQFVTDGGVAAQPFEARLLQVPVGKAFVLGWEVEVELVRGDHLRMIIAADDGRELRRDSYTISHRYDRSDEQPHGDDELGRRIDDGTGGTGADQSGDVGAGLVADGSSYHVTPLPIESPMHGAATTVVQPADATASPFGWHDTDGATGAESTLTTGNNVDAYRDADGDNTPDPGGRPDGGAGLDFGTPFDPTAAPDTSSNAAATVIQLFYANNWAHDFFYAYGFDEAAGNFQVNNYGRGGSGGDPVRAEALDGYGNAPDTSPPGVNRNNANFTTPPDGSPARMQMYGFTMTSPERGSSMDAGVVLHEYAHGWSNRLTGGRYAVTCLNNAEQMGEGWSDFAALMATMQPGDDGDDRRGIGNWVIGDSVDGRGIRQYPYSTDLSVDPRTYAWVPAASVPHGVGSIWATMLWELNWALIDRYGFDPDLTHGDGGNNLAMQLVTDGLKLQPCSPGFTDGRDAILAADRISNGGANQCVIWEAFAKRGLGWSARQGSPHDPDDGSPAFDLPAGCPLDVVVGDPAPASVGDVIRLDLSLSNHGGDPQSGVTVTVESAGLSPRPGTLSCDQPATATFSPSAVAITLGSITPGSGVDCAVDADVLDAATAATTLIDTDFESGLGPFTTSTDSGSNTWATTSSFPHGGDRAALATNPGSADETSDQRLTSPALDLPRCTTLRFWHRYQTEAGYDGGVIEVRHGSGPWTDLRGSIVEGAYTSRIATEYTNSAIAGRDAYSGLAWAHGRTTIDLDEHSGDDVRFRFRYVSDSTVTSAGWWIDDVVVDRPTGVVVEASATSSSSAASSDCAVLSVPDATPPPPPPPPPPGGSPSTPRIEAADMAQTDELASASRLGPQD